MCQAETILYEGKIMCENEINVLTLNLPIRKASKDSTSTGNRFQLTHKKYADLRHCISYVEFIFQVVLLTYKGTGSPDGLGYNCGPVCTLYRPRP